MAYIDYISVPDWDLDPDNILRIHGVNPPVLRAHFELYKTTMFGQSPLTRMQREMIAVVVSATNGCHY
jgi:alkylhydroperoxidase family enzyme